MTTPITDLGLQVRELGSSLAVAHGRLHRDERQQNQIMLMISEIRPGSVCLDSACPTGDPVPHMATDGGPHPHPYGLISDRTHEWRRKPWWKRRKGSR